MKESDSKPHSSFLTRVGGRGGLGGWDVTGLYLYIISLFLRKKKTNKQTVTLKPLTNNGVMFGWTRLTIRKRTKGRKVVHTDCVGIDRISVFRKRYSDYQLSVVFI